MFTLGVLLVVDIPAVNLPCAFSEKDCRLSAEGLQSRGMQEILRSSVGFGVL